MRIRRYRQEDLPALAALEEAAARYDDRAGMDAGTFERWLTAPQRRASENAFVITDDDDELNTWGQAGTLEGVEGEIAGYTVVEVIVDEQGYHLRCTGAVHPTYRRQHAGRALLISALNWARILAADFEFEAEREQRPVYFEALLPVRDGASPFLAAKCELHPTDEQVMDGMRLYRRDL